MNTWPTEPFSEPAPTRPDWAMHSAFARKRLRRWWDRELWWPWYTRYLASDLWQARRRFILSRAEHRCELCCARAATTIHHRTYARVGQEEPGDLVAVCDACHARIHGRE